MSAYSLAWAPHLPWSVLTALAVAAAALVAFALVRRAKGALLRLLFLVILLGALAHPMLRREQRDPLPDVALLLVDRSPSQRLAGREAQTTEAVDSLRGLLAGQPRLEVREIDLPGDVGGSRLVEGMDRALAEIDRSRLAAVIAVTDGQIHDAPPDATTREPLGAPLHVLLTGHPDEVDRKITVEAAPTFAMVDEPQQVRLRVDDAPADTGPVNVQIRQDGVVVQRLQARPGIAFEVPVTLSKAGPTVLEAEAAPRDGELTRLNNRVVVTMNGIRERLRVLLVSGQPYPGLRVWRNLLKADPAVDLVHFTILRPPEKQDGTPIRELALIAFPSRELFEVKLGEFDLVIFDRYNRRGLLPLTYLDNVARYVEEGGALLESAGPEFASPTSLYRTPLARVLPGRPSGEVFERPFTPQVSELGRRHPVTEGLAAAPDAPGWGPWFRQVDVEAGDAQVLMTGVADRPLLVLRRVGEGRVAQLLSDHAWLWARGYEEGGPQAALLRRLVHWLMKEPELEEEKLTARAAEGGILVERLSVDERPVEVTVTSPSGVETRLALPRDPDGVARARLAAAEDGLYRIADGTHTAYAEPRPIPTIELAELRATPDRLGPLAEATGGAVRWLAAEGVPELRRVLPDRRKEGRGWIGLQQNEAYTVAGVAETDLLPAWAALLLLLGAAALAWWREGRS